MIPLLVLEILMMGAPRSLASSPPTKHVPPVWCFQVRQLWLYTGTHTSLDFLMSSCKHVWDVEQWSKVHVWKETMKDVPFFFYLINIVILNRWSTPAWAQIFTMIWDNFTCNGFPIKYMKELFWLSNTHHTTKKPQKTRRWYGCLGLHDAFFTNNYSIAKPYRL